ncbi:hypothetical protein SAMN05192529_11763 [Arachidicoccus rhizosphaerae]|uniref:Uncharacterized protein n=1 Tax=Arachidicoccus rhizosphaerae TaxID=551991 RepID=A0A1H4AZV4_9BACT|nr:phage holin family protein [Arachidicoccus rhizosphaerae]SEA41419.1 hypothetical protein SAMN05192529_11763 [Arachidicoccus rhizosphaerae]
MTLLKIVYEIILYALVLGGIIYAFWFLRREMGVKGLFLGYIVLAGVAGIYLSYLGFLWQAPLVSVLGGIIVVVMIYLGISKFKKVKARPKVTRKSKGIPKIGMPGSKEEYQIIFQALDEVVDKDTLIEQQEFIEKFLREPIILNTEAAIFRNFYDCYTDVYGDEGFTITDFLSMFYCNGSKKPFNPSTFNKKQQRYSKGADLFNKMVKELNAIRKKTE